MILTKFYLPGMLAVGATVEVNNGFGGLPDPTSPQTIAWLGIALGSLLFSADKAIDLYKKYFKEQPEPSKTYLTVAAFEQHQGKRDADLKEIKDLIRGVDTEHEDARTEGIKEIKELIKGVEAKLDSSCAALQKEIKDSNTEQYKARGRMHRIINSLRDSLYHLSGLMGSRGSFMKSILDRGKQGDEEL